MKIYPNTVYEHFHTAFGVWPNDQSLKDLSVDTVCGKDCRAVIDAAAKILEMVGDLRDVQVPLLEATNAAVEVLWRG